MAAVVVRGRQPCATVHGSPFSIPLLAYKVSTLSVAGATGAGAGVAEITAEGFGLKSYPQLN